MNWGIAKATKAVVSPDAYFTQTPEEIWRIAREAQSRASTSPQSRGRGKAR
jgi:hypothetical protein